MIRTVRIPALIICLLATPNLAAAQSLFRGALFASGGAFQFLEPDSIGYSVGLGATVYESERIGIDFGVDYVDSSTDLEGTDRYLDRIAFPAYLMLRFMLSDSDTIAPYLHIGGGFGTVKAFVGDNTGEVSKRYNGAMYRAGIGLRLAERFMLEADWQGNTQDGETLAGTEIGMNGIGLRLKLRF